MSHAMRLMVAFLSMVTVALGSVLSNELDFGIAIDAGSTGTRIYLYSWPSGQSGKRVFITPVTREDWTAKVSPGISSFVDEPEKIGPSLQPLLDFAQQRILATGTSRDRFKEFSIYLKATAGMRVLQQSKRDNLMQQIRTFLSSGPFYFEASMARVLAGEEEGVYGWITVNFWAGTLFQPAQSYGVLDMGGASAEITFIPYHDEIVADEFTVRLKGRNFRLYTHSFMLFGVVEAQRRMRIALVTQTEPVAKLNSGKHHKKQRENQESPTAADGERQEPDSDRNPDAEKLSTLSQASATTTADLESLAQANSELSQLRQSLLSAVEESHPDWRQHNKHKPAWTRLVPRRSVPHQEEWGANLTHLAIERRIAHHIFANPCYARGYTYTASLSAVGKKPVSAHFVGSSNYEGCLEMSQWLIPKDWTCWTHRCSFAGVYQPHLHGTKFKAVSYFTTTVVDHLQLPRNATLQQISHAAKHICELDYDDLRKEYSHIDSNVLPAVCSNAVWIYTLLHIGHGFPLQGNQITFIDDPGQVGSMIYEANLLPWKLEAAPVASSFFAWTTLALLITTTGLLVYNMRLRKLVAVSGYRNLDGVDD